MNREYLITDHPAKALAVFAFPMIIGNLFQQFYTMADQIIVGRFVSEDALAAVGASFSLTSVFIAVAIGGGVGASVMVSRYFGARDYARMRSSISTSLLTFLFVSILMGVLGILSGTDLMRWLNVPEKILGQAVLYLNIYFAGLPFLFLYNILSSMFNALGRSRIPLYLLIFSSLFNIVLDLVMVRQLGMGVAGVALATLIAQGISAVISFLIFRNVLKEYPGKENAPLFSAEELSRSLKIALPSILQQATINFGMVLVQSTVNLFGTEVIAGYAGASRVQNMCCVPMIAMGNAMSSYTAQNLGAKKIDRVIRGYRIGGYGMVGLFALILCILIQILKRWLAYLFLGDAGSALAVGTCVDYLRFTSFFYFFIGIKWATDGVLRGSGHMLMTVIANMANLAFRVIVAMVMAPRYGVQWVWYAVPIGWFVNWVISYAAYRTGKWKE